MPRVSVILTSFNHARFLREAIESALNQTFSDFELIIWDDASTDDSWEIIQSYKDIRIKSFRNDEQKRGIYGINKAISEIAHGEYIAIHHSDDVWEYQKLEKQLGMANEHKNIGAVFTGVIAIDSFGDVVNDKNVYYTGIFDQKNKSRHEWLRQFFLQGNSLCHPSSLVRKECYARCGLYRYGLAQVGDFDMWIRLCMEYEIHVIPDRLVKFRVHESEGNTSAIRPDSRRRIPFEFLMVLDSYLEIASPNEVLNIFPDCRKYVFGKHSDCGYLLARAALDEKPFVFAQLWGQKILFDILNDAERAAQVKEWHQFDYIDFVHLTGRSDIFGYDEIARLNAELQRIK